MTEQVVKKDEYKFSRILYIIEAALEYFVAMAVSGIYLAKMTAYIGIPDSVTGVLSSFVSLGCGFQIIAIFLAHKKPVKRWVTALHLISQLIFTLLYFVPVFDCSTTLKTVIFAVCLLSARIVDNIVNSPKINWYMSLVEDKKRGRFTANKEIVSLLGGMVFSYFMGSMIDRFEAKGDMQTAFIVGGLTVFILCCLHTATLLFSKEKPAENTEKVSIWKEIQELLKDKTLFKVVLISVLWNIAHFVTTPFLSTYQTKELNFTTKFASIIVMAGSFFRVLCSKPLGRYADKHSFTKMLIICYIVEALSFALGVFIVPSNGKVMYTLHHLLYVGGMAGINSAVINLIYDYVDAKRRTSALALKQTLAGTAGFLTTLAVSPLVSRIQENGNMLFGIPVYAQQVLSLISFILTLGLLVYMLTVIRKIKK
jgi:Na+/melibiose symporter-like transporter